MVLRKERSSSEVGNTKDSKMSTNEQPVVKRQRIENTSSEINSSEPGTDDNSEIPQSDHQTLEFQDGAGQDELDQLSIVSSEIYCPIPLNYSPVTKNISSSSTAATTSIVQENDNEMKVFQNYLVKQCLCGVTERALRKPFQSHYNQDINGAKRIATLTEWPQSKLLQFLSNLQLLFDIYLKQNQKGNICARIMDVCDALIRNEHNLIDEIIDLCDYNNKFVTFLAGRVLSSFLVISKDNMNNNWLKKIVNNLFLFENLDYVAVRKISFSLDIIKRIVEWKDIEMHPLDDITSNDRNNDHDREVGINLPQIENNYFAQYFAQNNSSSSSSSINSNNSSTRNTRIFLENTTSACPTPTSSTSTSPTLNTSIITHPAITNNCQIVTLTDSESFDTTHLKCVTIKILENKWPALVKNMSTLIQSHRHMNTSENCITTFLTLWEGIISVRANLSVVETLPFYAQLDKFELLLNQNLSCTIYKQMLTLFNEALCYGSTLALQDLLPEETCSLAHQIVRHVKDFRILDSLPRKNPENPVSLIEYIGNPIWYNDESFQIIPNNQNNTFDSVEMDKTLLQKMVLLVLKSVAVTVKEIRSDSSDSSIDSTDYEAFQDMVLIERSIRDVLKKLESFIKNTLEFHPESHFSKILIHLFDDQDDYLIEAMVCTLDVTAGISFRNNAFPELVSMLNPVYTFLEFLKMISNSSDLLLDLLVSNETCFLLYLLRFLKYIRLNWSMFVESCRDCGIGNNVLDNSMSVLIRLRLQISRLVSKSLYPYDISPILRLLESCESLYEGNELS